MQIFIPKNCNTYSTIFLFPSRYESPCLQEGIPNFNDKWAGRLIRNVFPFSIGLPADS
jgi:hypothetical protein